MAGTIERGSGDCRPKLNLEVTKHFEIVTHSASETLGVGRAMAQKIEAPCLVLLEGDLGSGKTTLAKGLIAGLGLAREDEVTSPSYTLVHEYGQERKVYHVDLYRIENPQELASLGLDELFGQLAIVIIEWGEKLGDNVGGPHLRIQMEYMASEDRKITMDRLGA